MDAFRRRNARWICWETLTPVGSPRRDWRNTLVGDGFLMVRHPEWTAAWKLMEEAVGGIRLIAG